MVEESAVCLPLYVEVVQRRESRASVAEVERLAEEFVRAQAQLRPGARLQPAGELAAHAECVTLCDVEHARAPPAAAPLRLRVHRLHERAPHDHIGEEESEAAAVLALPARELHGLWESLVFDDGVKRDTVRLVESALEFGTRGVDPLRVAWNRLVLLHGPPGTGKTSLCRALAHKLAVRLAPRFPRARLFELDAHALFSKWFAESGKLVARAFGAVRAAAADPRLLVVLLLDEAESLAAARRAALAAAEPSDAVRAVNAALTQLDRLRPLPNVLVLATTNVTGALDAAFADRADVKRRVGPPSARAAYAILRDCCAELAARGAVPGAVPVEVEHAEAVETDEASAALWRTAQAAASARVSGRALRRLPLLAHALHAAPHADMSHFVRALHAALLQHLREDDTFRADDDGAPPRPHSPATCEHIAL